MILILNLSEFDFFSHEKKKERKKYHRCEEGEREVGGGRGGVEREVLEKITRRKKVSSFFKK